MTAAIEDYFATINDAIVNHPRSQQTRIGPSEMGIDCDWCLAHKLAGVPEVRDAAWLPTVGTAVHAWLEGVFVKPRYLTETTVTVGQIGGEDITGSCDLYDIAYGWVIDHKIVGDTAIRNAKANGPTPQYRRQAHLYGLGFTRLGVPVNEVAVAYLPRNGVSLTYAHVWHEPFDQAVALDTLARCNHLNTRILEEGLGVVREGLDRAPGCWSCSRYPSPSGFTPLPRTH